MQRSVWKMETYYLFYTPHAEEWCAPMHIYTGAHPHTQTQHAQREGIKGVPVKLFCGNDFFAGKRHESQW